MILPMTLEQVGRELADEDTQPERIDSVNQAMEKFKPEIRFRTRAGEEETEFVFERQFRSLKDFDPQNIQKKVPGERNDIADLMNTIDLLYRLKDRWSLPAVKRAWQDPAQRRQILEALARLRGELEKVAQRGQGGER
jgi:predicted component of type VI protein secretion system